MTRRMLFIFGLLVSVSLVTWYIRFRPSTNRRGRTSAQIPTTANHTSTMDSRRDRLIARAADWVSIFGGLITLVALFFGIYVFRDDIFYRLGDRPAVRYSMEIFLPAYKSPRGAAWHMPNEGFSYVFDIRNEGRVPASEVRLELNAVGRIHTLEDNFSEYASQWGIYAIGLRGSRKEGGRGHSFVKYEFPRLPHDVQLWIRIGLLGDCSLLKFPPTLDVYYKDQYGTPLVWGYRPKAIQEIADFKTYKGAPMDCELPSLDEIENLTEWTSETVYYVRFMLRTCGPEPEMRKILLLRARLAYIYEKPRDVGTHPDRCKILLKLIKNL